MTADEGPPDDRPSDGDEPGFRPEGADTEGPAPPGDVEGADTDDRVTAASNGAGLVGTDADPDPRAPVDQKTDTPRAGTEDPDDGGITEGMGMIGPLEPQEIDTENAVFVLLGVVLVAGFVLAGLVGL